MTNSEARKRMTPTTDPCTLDAHVLAVTVRDLTATLERVRKVAEQCDPGASREVLAALQPTSDATESDLTAEQGETAPASTRDATSAHTGEYRDAATEPAPELASDPDAGGVIEVAEGRGVEAGDALVSHAREQAAVAMSQSSVQVRLTEDEKAAISTYLHECHACRQGTIDVEPCTCRPWHEGIETVLAARVAAVTAERDEWKARAEGADRMHRSSERGRTHERRRAEKAEAERDQFRHLLGSHADGHRCTCTMVRSGNHIEPPEWEQDPWCLTHPDMDQIVAEVASLREQIAAVEALADGPHTLINDCGMSVRWVDPDDIHAALAKGDRP